MTRRPRTFLPGVLVLLLCGCEPEASTKDDTSGGEHSEDELQDLDGDGYAQDLDCDDNDATTHPGADERCDGVDNDCDSQIDEDAIDAPIWYSDADRDGYGDPASSTSACQQPPDQADRGGDCDDTRADVHPEAKELCGNHLDDDCDADPGDCAFDESSSLEEAGARFTGEAAGDDAGWAVAGAGDVNGDSYADLLIGAPYSAAGGSAQGAAFLLLGDPSLTSASSSSLSTADACFTGLLGSSGSGGDQAGYAVSGAGDFNGDGLDDLLVGAPFHDESASGAESGVAYLVLGSSTLHDQSLASASLRLYGGGYPGDSVQAGSAVSGAGDFNGDGRDDLLIGAPFYDQGPDLDVGAAFLVLGGPQGGDLSLDAVDARYQGEAGADLAGYSLSRVGDANGDGLADILIGAPAAGAEEQGAAYLILGSSSPAPLDLDSADARLSGEDSGDLAGCSVAGVGDFDGDGLADLLVGAWSHDSAGDTAGAAWLVLGSSLDGDMALADEGYRMSGEAPQDYAGWAVAGAGDVNGDGLADLLVGAFLNDAAADGAGSTYLILGSERPFSGSLSGADARFTGEAALDYSGRALAGAGDVNGDGFDEILLGGWGNDAGGSYAGAAWLVQGRGE